MAQFSSAIQGTVVDASNAAVPEAKVTVKNVATGISREAATSSEGFYRISNLGPGIYSISVEKAGFSTAKQDSLDLGISAVARADFKLAVGTIAEQVEVREQAVLLETEQGRVSGRIEPAQLKELPINGRNILNLIALQPGVTGRGISGGLYSAGGTDSFSGETQPYVYTSGQRWEANNYTLDDTSTNGVARNGATNLTPNSEAVEEVRVVANNFSAVDGRNPGAQIQMITKGGTNEFHGVAAYYFVGNTLAARSEFEAALPSIRKHLFDLVLGGPVIKNRTFFFVTYEGLRQGGTRANQYTVETPQFRDFILSTRPNSIAAYVMKTYQPAVYPTQNIRDLGSPLPGANKWSATPDGIPDIGTAWFTPVSYRNAGQTSIRLDHELRPGTDRIYGSYFRTKNETMTTSGIREAYNRPQTEWTYYGNINYTHTFSANKINEFRAGVMQLLGRPDQFKSRMELLKVPAIGISGGVTGFGVSSYPNGWWQTNYHYKDIFSWVKNTHTIKVGGELRQMRGSAQNTSNYIPNYNFASILDFADDEALSMTRLVDPRTGTPATVFSQLKQLEWAAFIQDDWKVRRNFTLNIGLRYENYGIFKDKGDQLRALIFGDGSTYPERLANGRVDFVKRFNPPDNNNFAPRFGFAWDPRGDAKMSIRGGYGLAYDRLMNLPAENYRASPPLRATANLGILLGTPTFTYSLGDPTKPYLGFPVDPALQLGLDSRGGIKGARASITTVDPNIRNSYVHNWFFGVQRQMFGGTVIELSYLGSAGHKLINAVNLNRFAGDMLLTPEEIAAGKTTGTFTGLNPSFGSINMVQSTSNSIYQGGSLSVKRRFANGLSLQGAYTFGRAMDDTDQGVGTTSWQNAWSRRGERALAGFDVPQKLSIVGLWQMPFFKDASSPKAARYVLGGWELSGLSIYDSGQPMTVTMGGSWPRGDFNGDNNGGDRPNAPPNLQTSGWTRQQLLSGIFTVSQFAQYYPTPGTDGNMVRNSLRGNSFMQIDFALAKTFNITEKLNANLRVDAYNALNKVNLNDPNLDLNSANFGRSTSQSSPRFVQVGLKLRF